MACASDVPVVCQAGGNTESPAPRTSNHARYRWCFTIKRSEVEPHVLCQLCQEACKQFTFQHERGEGGYEHYQGVLSLKVKHRLSELKNLLGISTAHLEPCRSWVHSLEYCSKKEGRLAGPWTERSKFTTPVVLRHGWQRELEARLRGPVDPRRIIWFRDLKGGEGKTQFALYAFDELGAFICQNGASRDIAHMYPEGCRIVIFDVERSFAGHFNYGILERIKNGYLMSTKYEGAIKRFDAPHIVVFANEWPQFTALSADRWDLWDLAGGCAKNVTVDDVSLVANGAACGSRAGLRPFGPPACGQADEQEIALALANIL